MKIKNFDSNTTKVSKFDYDKTIDDNYNESKFYDKSGETTITRTLQQTQGTEHNLVSMEQSNPLGLFEFKIKETKEQFNTEFELKHPVKRNNLMERERI